MTRKMIEENEHENNLTMPTHNQSTNDGLQGLTKTNSMEIILKSPGLKHIAECIFWNLDYDDLEKSPCSKYFLPKVEEVTGGRSRLLEGLSARNLATSGPRKVAIQHTFLIF